jgi:hypothetical protein
MVKVLKLGTVVLGSMFLLAVAAKLIGGDVVMCSLIVHVIANAWGMVGSRVEGISAPRLHS